MRFLVDELLDEYDKAGAISKPEIRARIRQGAKMLQEKIYDQQKRIEDLEQANGAISRMSEHLIGKLEKCKCPDVST